MFAIAYFFVFKFTNNNFNNFDFKNKKKVLSASNTDVNTNIASESTLIHKETTQTIIDLSDDLTEHTKDVSGREN
ncbi:hypothetical protein RhiirC2_799211 [Rhizophagus irregularis]|uniref:Uncharacterized protein n=1 Tax=Rhizophagus irregularis TaxID=588596 RepID=A0A2N1M5B8_9GLOM|nr:hypothetical protein RhiirC2_799211 [Rhizophagus irregularis]